tara:strand:+ start:254 stop:553 length:300 start_codon:yes stop_codon:yes gene_type:complete
MNLYLLESSDFYCKSELTFENDNYRVLYNKNNATVYVNEMCVFRDYKDEIEQITSDPRFDMISQELENNIKCYKSFEINKFENLYTIILVNLFTCIFYF